MATHICLECGWKGDTQAEHDRDAKTLNAKGKFVTCTARIVRVGGKEYP